MLRNAGPEDFSDVCTLLTTAGLSSLGVSENLDSFFVFELGDAVVGVGGLELRGPFALLRSLAVVLAHQHRGMGLVICDCLEAEAVRRGVTHIYLLTETAERFFSKRGYISVARADAPPEIASSEQFARICSESAVFMRRVVAQQCAAAGLRLYLPPQLSTRSRLVTRRRSNEEQG